MYLRCNKEECYGVVFDRDAVWIRVYFSRINLVVWRGSSPAAEMRRRRSHFLMLGFCLWIPAENRLRGLRSVSRTDLKRYALPFGIASSNALKRAIFFFLVYSLISQYWKAPSWLRCVRYDSKNWRESREIRLTLLQIFILVAAFCSSVNCLPFYVWSFALSSSMGNPDRSKINFKHFHFATFGAERKKSIIETPTLPRKPFQNILPFLLLSFSIAVIINVPMADDIPTRHVSSIRILHMLCSRREARYCHAWWTRRYSAYFGGCWKSPDWRRHTRKLAVLLLKTRKLVWGWSLKNLKLWLVDNVNCDNWKLNL